MATPNDNISMALYCDFENVALGVRDAKYDKFDIRPVLERLLLKGSIVVKKAYCDWDRYKEFKPQMHEASFELIEIPHVRQSGKNSADIRMVVDALDLCYTKAHVNTFVIISGDSDFSPLVSKLRENAKFVIGVGVKNSSSDLLIANCDEFIFIDDLVREIRRNAASREVRQAPPAGRRASGDDQRRKEEIDTRKTRAVTMAAETFEALMAERGDGGKIWASVLKQAIKRRKPDFNEAYFGFRTFGNLLEEAQSRGLLEVGRDDKSGAYVYRSSRPAAASDSPTAAFEPGAATVIANGASASEASASNRHEARRNGKGRGGSQRLRNGQEVTPPPAPEETAASPVMQQEPDLPVEPIVTVDPATEQAPRQKGRGSRRTAKAADQRAPAITPDVSAMPDTEASAATANTPEPPAEDTPRRAERGARKTSRKKTQATVAAADETRPPTVPEPVETVDTGAETRLPVQPLSDEGAPLNPPVKAARKTPARGRRPRKSETNTAEE